MTWKSFCGNAVCGSTTPRCFAGANAMRQSWIKGSGGWITLFDGTHLDHWNRLGEANWTVADGIVQADQKVGCTPSFVHLLGHTLAGVGIGIQAIGLVTRGYTAHATHRSPAAILQISPSVSEMTKTRDELTKAAPHKVLYSFA